MEPVEREQHLRDYLKVVLKRQWTVLAVFLTVVTVTAVGVFRQDYVYQATARLHINRENPNILSIKEVVEVDTSSDYYQTQYNLLRSRSLAQDVIRRLDLARHPDFTLPMVSANPLAGVARWFRRLFAAPPPPETSAAEGRANAEDAATSSLVNAFLGRVSVNPVRSTRLVDVAVRSRYPRLAASMANTVVQTFIQNSQDQRLSTTREATDWLSKQLEEARAKVEESENALQDYKERFGIVASEAKEDLVSQRLTEAGAVLTQARMERIQREIRYQQLQKMQAAKESLDSLPELNENPLVQQLRREHAGLQGELEEQSKTYTPKHPKIIALRSKLEGLEDRIALETQKVARSLKTDFEGALVRERALQEEMDRQKRAVQNRGQQSIRLSVLEREVENNRRIYDMLLARAKETSLSEGLQTGNIKLIDRAEVPLAPISPNRPRAILLAMLVGLAGGVGLAFFLEYLDDTVKDPDDLQQHVQLPMLAPVPLIDPEQQGTKIELISWREPKSSYAETFRSARTNVLLTSPDRRPQTLLVTSPGPGEGKTTTSVNLAVTMAAAGSRVLLVDADLRKPRVHKVFDFDNRFGLSTLLTESTDVGAALKQTPVDNLTVMTSGPVPPNPAELLGSQRMKRLIETLAKSFDVVVFDTAPLISVTDATLMAVSVDGIIVVIRAGHTSRQILLRGKKQLEDVRAHVLGVVLNGINIQKSRYYYYPRYYYTYYGEDGATKKRTKRGKVFWKREKKDSKGASTPSSSAGHSSS